MEIIRSARPAKEMTGIKIWHCAGCGVVHLAVKEMVLNFSRDDFAAFPEAVIDIHYTGWPHAGYDNSLIDLASGRGGFSSAECTIH